MGSEGMDPVVKTSSATMSRIHQMPLALKPPRRPSFDNYIQGENQSVVHTLQHGLEPAQWYLLMGPRGSGLSHLLSSCFQAHLARGEEGVYLSLSDKTHWPLLEQANAPYVFLDDVDQVSISKDAERALFNALNRWRMQRNTIVMSAVSLNPIQLPDLVSRLGQATRLTLKPLDEASLQHLVVRLAQDQEIPMSAEVARYIVSRTTRNASELSVLMNELMMTALSDKRPITVPMVRSRLSER